MSRRRAAAATPSATSMVRSAAMTATPRPPTRTPGSTARAWCSGATTGGRPWEPATGKEAKLCHMGHLLMENRNGLIVDALLTPATGTAEREAAETMLARQSGRHRATLAADKGYDAAGFVATLRALHVTPHIAQNTSGRRSAIDARTTRQPGYAVSLRVRKRIEEAFGWIKTSAGFRKTRHRGTARVGWLFTLTATACNLVRLPKLLAAG